MPFIAEILADEEKLKKENLIVKFNGFIIDFFKTESGSLGMTVEVGEEITPDAPSVDIFVDKNLNIYSTHPKSTNKNTMKQEEITIIPFSVFSSWIKSQDDNKSINMDENGINCNCGCIMIQYAREHNIKCDIVGMVGFIPNDKPSSVRLDQVGGKYIIKCLDNRVKTFKEAKELI